MKQILCEHNHTTLVSLDSAYYVECLDCGRQFSEEEAVEIEEQKQWYQYQADLGGEIK